MKSKTVAALFAFFLGGIGAHKFYLGKIGQGILYLLFVWSGIPAIVGLIEGISYLTMSKYDFNEKFNILGDDISNSSYVGIPVEGQEKFQEIDNGILSDFKSFRPEDKATEEVLDHSNEGFDPQKPIRTSSLADARKKMASAVKSKTE